MATTKSSVSDISIITLDPVSVIPVTVIVIFWFTGLNGKISALLVSAAVALTNSFLSYVSRDWVNVVVLGKNGDDSRASIKLIDRTYKDDRPPIPEIQDWPVSTNVSTNPSVDNV